MNIFTKVAQSKAGQAVAKAAYKTGKELAKNSPLLLTIGGAVGLGTTAVLAYKSSDKIEEITEDIENQRAIEADYNDLHKWVTLHGAETLSESEQKRYTKLAHDYKPISRVDISLRIAKVVALPVATGLASVCAIALSYAIMNNRLHGVAASLAAVTAEQTYFKSKYTDEYGDEEAEKFFAPIKKEMVKVPGKKKEQEVEKKDDKFNGFTMQWFDQSSQYVSDDHIYNLQYVNATIENLQNRLFRKTSITLNEVRDAFGFPRDKNGANVGWSVNNEFDPVVQVANFVDESTGEFKPQILIKWGTPAYIWDVIDYHDDSQDFRI